MNRNIEIKVAVKDLKDLEERVKAIADSGPAVIYQEDTFFPSPSGRFKLRKVSSTQGELIVYDRPDTTMPAESRYYLVPTAVPEQLRDVLARALGVRGAVRKRRSLYLIGQTRVHLDIVEGLGRFMELEVVLRPEQDAGDGVKIARELMTKLAVPEDGLVEKAYIDLLERERQQTA